MSNFEVGNRVGMIDDNDLERWNEEENTSQYGEVIAVLDKGQVRVKWDKDWRGNEVEETVSASELHLESDLKSKLTDLEQEYNSFADKVKDKVKEAAKLLREASDLADENGFELANMSEAVSPMLGAMRHAGWRTSALWC